MHLAYIWIVSHLCAKNYRNWWKFEEVLTKTNLLSSFWDTVYMYACQISPSVNPVSCASVRVRSGTCPVHHAPVSLKDRTTSVRSHENLVLHNEFIVRPRNRGIYIRSTSLLRQTAADRQDIQANTSRYTSKVSK